MTKPRTNFNNVYSDIIANSLFTERQIYIISNRLTGKTILENISRGAYHRQLKQCRNKIRAVLYSLLLLKSIGAIDQQTLSILKMVCEQMSVILDKDNSDITEEQNDHNVILTLNHILKKLCKV